MQPDMIYNTLAGLCARRFCEGQLSRLAVKDGRGFVIEEVFLAQKFL